MPQNYLKKTNKNLWCNFIIGLYYYHQFTFTIMKWTIVFIFIFGRCIFWPSSDVSCRTREPIRNFEPRPLFNPRGLLAMVMVNGIRATDSRGLNKGRDLKFRVRS